MNTLGIDIECFSSVSLKQAGMHKYVSAPDFEILLISYSWNGADPVCIPLQQWNMAGHTKEDEEQYKWFIAQLTNPDTIKTAWNAAFERTCLSKDLKLHLPIIEWECTMVRASMAGWPLKLEECTKAMKLVEGKLETGSKLIKYFCTLTKEGVRHFCKDDWQRWLDFQMYNIRDVKVEQAILRKLEWFKMPYHETKYWYLDQKINDYGVRLDKTLIRQALIMNRDNTAKLLAEATKITGLANPNSVPQLKQWIGTETGEDLESLNKEDVKHLIESQTDPDLLRLLAIRQEISKTSIKKYKAMAYCINGDERARGLFQFNGAPKTARWSGRIIQVHNLPKNKIEQLDVARELALEGDPESIELLFGNISDVISQLIRTAFIPDKDHAFLVSDFSAIEARVLAWFAREEWRLEVFRGDGKIYEASGARMFKTTPEAVAADRDGLRFKAKTAELALGFQGSVGAIDRMETMGLKTGLADEEKLPLVHAWRAANQKIVALWYAVEEAALEAVLNPGMKTKTHGLKFQVKHDTLFILLPSGRLLCYNHPSIKEKYGRQSIAFWGVDQETTRWSRLDTYGGKLVENIVQGTSRDLLAAKMLKLDEAGFKIVMHVHDEVVLEVKKEDSVEFLKKVGDIMSEKVTWAADLPLAAESFITPYYIKK